MDKQEKIVCAAVNIVTAKEGNFILEEVFCGVDYQSIENTNIFKTYCDALNVISKANGFITSKNRFVDAKEAMRIAISQCQIYSVELLYRELNTHNASPRYDNWQLHHDQIKAGIALMESSLLARELKPEDLY